MASTASSAPADPVTFGPAEALYVHVPFCLHRCGYCDFTLVADRDDLIPAYLTALRNEIDADSHRLDRRRTTSQANSIFVGGGTPSHLSNQQLQQFGVLIQHAWPPAANCEFTMEANPDGLNRDKMQAIRDIGVNRLSLGVQSFDDHVLKTLERQHDAGMARSVVENAAAIFDSVSVDLIFGVPGQTRETWQQTLQTAIDLPVQHVSTYGLTFEKGTSFFRRQREGDLQAVADELERSMYADAIDILEQAGFRHYEISNFAIPGRECRHNFAYWTGRPYLAYGPGAARYVNGIRSTNARSVKRWIESWLNHQPALQESEQLNNKQRAREAIFLGLRLVDGFDMKEFARRFRTTVNDLAGESLQHHLSGGSLQIIDDHLRLTREGRFIADSVVTDFLA